MKKKWLLAAAGLAYLGVSLATGPASMSPKDIGLHPVRELAFNVTSHSEGGKFVPVAKINPFERGEYTGAQRGQCVPPNPDRPSAARFYCRDGGPNLLGIYLKTHPNDLAPAKHLPSHAPEYDDVSFYSLADRAEVIPFESRSRNYYLWSTDLLENILRLPEGDMISQGEIDSTSRSANALAEVYADLGNYTTSIGRDRDGPYLSIFDIWDFEPRSYNAHVLEDYRWQALAMEFVGEPFGIYQRHYLDESAIHAELSSRGNHPLRETFSQS